MYTANDFIEYFVAHGDLFSGEELVRTCLADILESVDACTIDTLMHKIISEKIRFRESSCISGFKPKEKEVFFPLKHDYHFTGFYALGHVLDFISYEAVPRRDRKTKKDLRYKSSRMLLSSGKSLREIVDGEVKERFEEIYNVVDDVFKQGILGRFGIHSASQYLTPEKERRWQLSVSISLTERCRDKAKRWCAAFMMSEKWEKVKSSAEHKCLWAKYGFFIDMLLERNGRPGVEFFAHMFSATVCGNEEALELARAHFPRSTEAFYELYEAIRKV